LPLPGELIHVDVTKILATSGDGGWRGRSPSNEDEKASSRRFGYRLTF